MTLKRCIGQVILLMGLTACQPLLTTETSLYKPQQPPVLKTDHYPSQLQITQYQEDLFGYIQYLERYYIYIGMTYNGNTEIPTRKTDKEYQCKIVSDIFKDIPLPPPPKATSQDLVKLITPLAEHIVQLRKQIRSNNAYMASLRERYKQCR